MSWLAASLAISSAAVGGLQLSRAESAAWHQIEPSVAILQSNGAARGITTLVAPGWFLAQRSVVGNLDHLSARFFKGGTVSLSVVKIDSASQLVLLQAQSEPGQHPVPLLFSAENFQVDEGHPVRVLAVLASGAIPAQLVSTNEVGILNNSSAAIRFSEIHFESAPSSVAGAPIFTLDGKLLGILEATLAPAASGDGLAKSFAPASNRGLNVTAKKFGPAGMIVAYSPSPDTMGRVIAGFLTPSHEVQRPAIGIFCRNAPGGGAVVESVMDDSPAQAAGIMHGDVITSVNGQAIADTVDFAKVMTNQKIGSTVAVVLKRSGQARTLQVKIGF